MTASIYILLMTRVSSFCLVCLIREYVFPAKSARTLTIHEFSSKRSLQYDQSRIIAFANTHQLRTKGSTYNARRDLLGDSWRKLGPCDKVNKPASPRQSNGQTTWIYIGSIPGVQSSIQCILKRSSQVSLLGRRFLTSLSRSYVVCYFHK